MTGAVFWYPISDADDPLFKKNSLCKRVSAKIYPRDYSNSTKQPIINILVWIICCVSISELFWTQTQNPIDFIEPVIFFCTTSSKFQTESTLHNLVISFMNPLLPFMEWICPWRILFVNFFYLCKYFVIFSLRNRSKVFRSSFLHNHWQINVLFLCGAHNSTNVPSSIKSDVDTNF